jgi:hypothetical protein
MKKKYSGFFICFLVLLQNIQAQEKGRTLFTKGWKVKLDSVQSYANPETNDASWRTLNLHHDWSIEGTFSEQAPLQQAVVRFLAALVGIAKLFQYLKRLKTKSFL